MRLLRSHPRRDAQALRDKARAVVLREPDRHPRKQSPRTFRVRIDSLSGPRSMRAFLTIRCTFSDLGYSRRRAVHRLPAKSPRARKAPRRAASVPSTLRRLAACQDSLGAPTDRSLQSSRRQATTSIALGRDHSARRARTTRDTQEFPYPEAGRRSQKVVLAVPRLRALAERYARDDTMLCI